MFLRVDDGSLINMEAYDNLYISMLGMDTSIDVERYLSLCGITDESTVEERNSVLNKLEYALYAYKSYAGGYDRIKIHQGTFTECNDLLDKITDSLLSHDECIVINMKEESK